MFWNDLFTPAHYSRLYRLDTNKKLLEIFVYPSNSGAFYRTELNL